MARSSITSVGTGAGSTQTPTPADPASRTGVIVMSAAWGYMPLDVMHPGVQAAKVLLQRVDGVNWDLIAEIAHLAGDAASGLVILGGAEVNEILSRVGEELVARAVARERGR